MRFVTIVTNSSTYPDKIIGVFEEARDAEQYVKYLDSVVYKTSTVPYFKDLGFSIEPRDEQ